MTIPAYPEHDALVTLVHAAEGSWERAATLKDTDAHAYWGDMNNSVQRALRQLRHGLENPTASDEAWRSSVRDSMFRFGRKVNAATDDHMRVRYLASAIIDLETRLFGRGLIEVKA